MMDRELAVNSLKGVYALAQSIEDILRTASMPQADFDDLEKYQVRNRHVVQLLEQALSRHGWDAALLNDIRRFLLDEFEAE